MCSRDDHPPYEQPVRRMLPKQDRPDPSIASKPEPVRRVWINGRWVESK